MAADISYFLFLPQNLFSSILHNLKEMHSLKEDQIAPKSNSNDIYEICPSSICSL